jgi:hypothetical protein
MLVLIFARVRERYGFARNRYATSGAQIRKLAKPGMKNVGMSLSGSAFGNQIETSAVHAHRSMKVQNDLSANRSVIRYSNGRAAREVAVLARRKGSRALF